MATKKKPEKAGKKSSTLVRKPAAARPMPSLFGMGLDGDLENFVDNVFEDFRLGRWPRLRAPERWFESQLAHLRVPAVDVREENSNYVVEAELPGVTEEDLDVTLAQGRLTIKGEKRREEETEEGDYHRSERSYGHFSRSVILPTDVDEDHVTASFKDGVLKVTLPKAEHAREKKLEVKAA